MSNQYGTAQIVDDGLVLCLDAADANSYPGSGTTWTDLTGNDSFQLNGTYTFGSDPKRILFPSGYAGNNSGSTIPAAWQGDQECTIDTWYYMDLAKTGCCDSIFGRYDFRLFQIAGAVYLMIGFDNGTGTRTYQHPAVALAHDAWHHVVGMRRGNDYIMWIDGAQVYNTTWGIGLSLWDPGGEPWYINTAAHDAEYSVCRIWNRGLSDAEILHNYNAQRTRFGV